MVILAEPPRPVVDELIDNPATFPCRALGYLSISGRCQSIPFYVLNSVPKHLFFTFDAQGGHYYLVNNLSITLQSQIDYVLSFERDFL